MRQGYKFRSKVIVEFGGAFEIPMEYAKLYETNKREAISKLLKKVERVCKG